MRWRYLTFWLILLSTFILDQASKFASEKAAMAVEGRTFFVLWPGVFELKLAYNKGIAYGLLQGIGPWLTPLAVVIFIYCAWTSFRARNQPFIFHLGLSLLASGAAGNTVDRAFKGKVVDMFYVRAIDFPVFNVADACVTVAAISLLIAGFLEPVPNKEKSGAKKLNLMAGETLHAETKEAPEPQPQEAQSDSKDAPASEKTCNEPTSIVVEKKHDG